MKKVLRSSINYLINKAKQNKFVQNIFESPFELDKFPKMGEFVDSNNNKYELLGGLRSKLRPHWRRMLTPQKTTINNSYLTGQKSKGNTAISKIIPLIESQGKSIAESSILEIGCHSGGSSFAFAEYGAAKVTGTEFSGYKVSSLESSSKEFENKLIEVNDQLKEIRNGLAKLFKHSNKVTFIDDDICNTALKPLSFDIICSWDVLEHLHDTASAFVSMNKLLKDDGIMIHEYNPFFGLNGGHSLCTLDMLWGHTQLNDVDFEKYITKFRPEEIEKALSFYRNGLNRMTLYDIDLQLKKAKFEMVSIIPFVKEQHLRMIDHDILFRSQKHYPNVTLLDMASPRVYVVARKKQENNLRENNSLTDD